ncbi:MAG: putative sulfate exporter family transporter, partial [Rhodospirillales bacterium]|nr:putative sulfate exporter family transporter [Rhodospirillales bacterium]
MKRAVAILPGFALCVGIAAAAAGLEHIEAHLFGRAWFEMLVLAILLGAAVR